MKTFQFQEVIDDNRIDSYLIALNLLKENKEVCFQFSASTKISPAGYALLAVLSDTAWERRCQVNWKYLQKNRKKQNPFLLKLNTLHQENRFLPSPEIYDHDTFTSLLKGNSTALDLGFMETFESKFELGEDLLFDCKLILNELMQNTLAHSGAERYFVYGGLWKEEIHLGVLDMGVSIPAKLRQKYEEENDLAYLLLALKEGSTTRRQRMGGFGLAHFHDFLQKNKGKLTIASGWAQIRIYFNTRNRQKSRLKRGLPGTWCFARIPFHQKPNQRRHA